METSHSYEGLGADYLKARNGSPRFASFIVANSGLDGNHPVRIVELGIGSGQQTEFVEKELRDRGITRYEILAYDRSARQNDTEPPGQLDVLKDRIDRGEISERVVPIYHDFDGVSLPVESESTDFTYMGHVVHHIQNKEEVFRDISRITKKGSCLFILGVTLEAMKDHPLDEFFPTKYEYEVGRYPSRKKLIKLFKDAGFTWERPVRVRRHIARPIDRDFLTAVENTTLDSAFNIMRDKDPGAFREGVERIRNLVEEGEKSGEYRIYLSLGRIRIFWGRKE